MSSTPVPTHDSRSPRRAWLVFILGALSAFGPLSIDMYLPALPSLSRDFGTGASQAQLTLSACLLGLALGQTIAGPISDALGRRRPLLVGLTAYALASLLCVVAPSVLALVVLRFVQGCAGAAGIVIARAVVRDLHSGEALARFFSLLMLVNGLAPILAPLFGGLLLRFTSWRGVFIVLAFAAMFAYISGSPFVLQDIYGLSPQLFSVMFGANALGLMTAGQINGRLVGRVPLTRLLAAGLTATATGGVALFAVVITGGIGLVGILPSLFVVVSSLGFVLPNATALALSGHPRNAGSASALLGVLQFAIGAAAAPLVGALGSRTALPMSVVMATLGVCALVTFALLVRGSESPASRAAANPQRR